GGGGGGARAGGGAARPAGALPGAAGPAGGGPLSSVSGSAAPAARRYRAPGGSHNAVSRRIGAPGSSPDVSRPAPSITYHNSPPGLAGASTADPGGTSTRRLTRPSRPGAVSSRVRTTTSMPLSSQIGAFQVFAGQQLSRGTFEHDLPGRQDVAPVGDGQRHRRVLLHHQDRDAGGVDVLDDLKVLLHQRGGQAHRRLVHQQQPGPRHQRA